jgi:hypothetical protein
LKKNCSHEILCLQGITTLISSVYQNRGHAQVVATNLKQRRMYNLTNGRNTY